jgi:hypothetical protein
MVPRTGDDMWTAAQAGQVLNLNFAFKVAISFQQLHGWSDEVFPDSFFSNSLM